MFHIAEWSKPFVVAGSVLLIVSSLAPLTALAQESFTSTAHHRALPDAPQPVQNSTPSGANGSQQTDTGSLSGTVLDTNRDVLQGARVTLAGPSGFGIRGVGVGRNGEVAFTGLPWGVFNVPGGGPGGG